MKTDALHIPLSVYNEMVQHGLEELPYEACGILSGREKQVSTLWKLQNEKERGTAILLVPKRYLLY